MLVTLITTIAIAGVGAPAKLTPGTVLKTSTNIPKAVYKMPSKDDTGATAALTISGDNIVVDFQGATLEGTPPKTEPDARVGTGLRIKGNNVTIKNLILRGYKIGLIAKDAQNLKIYNSDFSYNWKQHLASTLEREDLSDWMSFHHNEEDEWLRYGAAIYLRNCDGAEVKGSTALGGQNGLMMTECDNGLVWNNNFSFLSGAGLAMYRSSDNRIMHNKIDWCVRGYSHGVYNRGQDSSGVIIYEQSHRNIFAYNSATHGGDGFFLWAGQTTMDTGQGGVNDNLLYGNDFSDSPANAIEATFSRNKFVNNLLIDCWHGVWGGYSYDTLILGNVFGYNGESIAIEHGQNNQIKYNLFDRDTIGVYLWQNDGPPDPNWGYPKFKDVRNVGTIVEGNLFRNIADVALEMGTSTDVVVRNNTFLANKTYARFRGKQEGVKIEENVIATSQNTMPVDLPEGVSASDNEMKATPMKPAQPVITRGGNSLPNTDGEREAYLKRFVTSWNPWPNKPILPAPVAASLGKDQAERAERELREFVVQPLPGGMNPFLKPGDLRGRRYMLVDEWGPVDFRYPIMWPRGVVETPQGNRQRFEILGPKGTWRVVTRKGIASVSAESGQVPGIIDLGLTPGQANDIEVVLEYKGGPTVDYRGIPTAAGTPVRFGFHKFFAPIDWKIEWFNWDPQTQDPRTMTEAFEELLKTKPVATMTADRLEGAWGGSPHEGVNGNNFATVARGEFTIPKGEYTLNVTADDGVRVWVDGKLVIDEWHYSSPTLYKADLKLGGKHQIGVRHFEIDGYSALKVELVPKAK